jgi:hypothetical protein
MSGDEKKEKPSLSDLQKSLKEAKKKKAKANSAARDDVFWGVFNTALVAGLGVALFFLFPHVVLTAFVAITLVTAFVAFSAGILGDPLRNVTNLKAHRAESDKEGKEIAKIKGSISDEKSTATAAAEKKQAEINKANADARKAAADAEKAEIAAQQAEKEAAAARKAKTPALNLVHANAAQLLEQERARV